MWRSNWRCGCRYFPAASRGIIQFGKITYIYYSLQKTVNAIASYLAVQNGVNFCPDAGDPTIAAAIEFGLTGTTDGSGPLAIVGLTADMFSVTTQCIDPVTLTLGDCVLVAAAARRWALSGRISSTVSMPNGYIIQPRIPYILVDPIPLKPQAVPWGIRRRAHEDARALGADRRWSLRCCYSAVILPLTFMIVFVSEMLWIWHSVVDFTRDGANYAATHCWMGDGSNVTNYMTSHVPRMIDMDKFQNGEAGLQVSYFSLDPGQRALTPSPAHRAPIAARIAFPTRSP